MLGLGGARPIHGRGLSRGARRLSGSAGAPRNASNSMQPRRGRIGSGPMRQPSVRPEPNEGRQRPRSPDNTAWLLPRPPPSEAPAEGPSPRCGPLPSPGQCEKRGMEFRSRGRGGGSKGKQGLVPWPAWQPGCLTRLGTRSRGGIRRATDRAADNDQHHGDTAPQARWPAASARLSPWRNIACQA